MTLQANLYLGSAAVSANQVALQIVGNNISNISTPGYVRGEADFKPIASSRFGNLSLGNGVTVAGVTQKIDQFLAERARATSGQFQAANTRSAYLKRTENIFNDLSGQDIAAQYSAFESSLQDIQNRPDEPTLRDVAIQKGQVLADSIRSVRDQIDGLRKDINSDVSNSVDQINQGLDKIKALNEQIVPLEAAGDSKAGSLRALRDQELAKLTDKIDIQVVEQPTGAVNVMTGGDYLLFDGVIQKVGLRQQNDHGIQTQTLVLAGRPLDPTGGSLGGAQQARDVDIPAVIDSLDKLSQSLIVDFNKIHSSGQGLENFKQVTGTNRVTDPTAALNSPQSGLPSPPTNGSFELRIGNPVTGQATTNVIKVDLSGSPAETLNSLIGKINAAFGSPVASTTPEGKLQIQAPPDTEFSFAKDTSGVLTSLGVNTFFTGQDSRDINVNDTLKSNPSLLAASTNGLPGDVSNITKLVQFKDQPVAALGNVTFSQYSTGMVSQLGSISQSAKVDADTLQTSKQALESENLSITGVDLNEETVKLLAYQQSFQASARYISTINQLLETVINLGR